MTAPARSCPGGVEIFVLVGIILLLLPRFGLAHTLGVSTAEFLVQPDGRVEARFVFASGEPLGAAGDLGDLVRNGVDIAADGARCSGVFRGAEPTETDGLSLSASYACPDDAARVEVTLYYLSALPPGHREVARIVAGAATVEAVLTGDHRALGLRLPEPSDDRRIARRRVRQVIAGAAVLSVIALALLAWAARNRPA
jgi:hypothetical protein